MVWIAIFIITFLIEIFTVSLVSVWMALGSIIAFLFYHFGFSLYVQCLAFIVSSLIFLYFLKPLSQKYWLKHIKEAKSTPLIGEKGKVVTHISNQEEIGEVKVKGVTYTARSVDAQEIKVGETVVVERIEGNKLYVRLP